jgi:hypothetical protein
MSKTKKPQRSKAELLRIAKTDERMLPELPPAPEGFVYRWVRVTLQGKDDVNNISRYKRSGWEFVKPEDFGQAEAPLLNYGTLEGYVGVGDLALAKLPADVADARQELVHQKTRDLMQAVNYDLKQNDDRRMPMFNESKSTSARGREARFDT